MTCCTRRARASMPAIRAAIKMHFGSAGSRYSVREKYGMRPHIKPIYIYIYIYISPRLKLFLMHSHIISSHGARHYMRMRIPSIYMFTYHLLRHYCLIWKHLMSMRSKIIACFISTVTVIPHALCFIYAHTS